jgi:hypothetical protein
MRVVGMWMPCDDGAVRPVIECLVTGSGARQVDEHFFVDSCADCTVLSADLLKRLNLTGKPPPRHLALKGISGAGSYVVVNTVVEFLRAEDGIRGEMAAFTDPTATDFSILGRDYWTTLTSSSAAAEMKSFSWLRSTPYQVTG